MKIEVGYATSRLVADNHITLDIREKSASPITSFNKWTRQWSTTNEYTMEVDGVFPTGLWRNVRRWLRELGHEPEMVDTRVRKGAPPNLDLISLVGIELFPFQRDAIATALKARNAIIKAATAAGKSAIIFGATQALPDVKSLVVTESKKVAKQLADEYERLTCEKAGRCLAGAPWKDGQVVFASFSQFAAKLAKASSEAACRRYLATFGAVFVDEVQCAAAATHYRVLMALTQTEYRIGLSGTPFGRSDGKHEFVIGATGPQVADISAGELVDIGRVAHLKVRFIAYHHRPIPPSMRSKGDWEPIYQRIVVTNDTRNALIMRVAAVAAKPCFIFAERLSHCAAIEKLLRKDHWAVKTVTGETSDAAAEAALSAVRAGRLDIIVTNKVMNAGVSVVNLASVINAGAGRANVATVQRPGRAMRIMDGKDTCEYYDIADIIELETQTKERMKHLRREGHEVVLMEVEEFAAFAAERLLAQ